MDRIDINKASGEDLRSKCDMAPTTVETLLKTRPFKNFDDIDKVPGIGSDTVDKLRRHNCFPGG